MFEKEAEEYVNTHVAPPFSISEQDLYDCFQRAVTFGYNKAKEDADEMKSRFLELCNLKDMRIKELEKVNEYAKTIIQDLLDNSEWIAAYQKGNEEMKKEAYKSAILTILKLRNCMNCKYRDTRGHSSCKDKGIVLCSHWEMKE